MSGWSRSNSVQESASRVAEPPSRGVLAIKFGGTSLGTAARVRLAARRIRSLRSRGWLPVAVVSAAGSTTDRLLRQLEGVAGQRARHARPAPTATSLAREMDRVLATGEDRSAALLAAALCALGVPATSVRAHEAILRAAGRHGRGRLTKLEPGAISGALGAGIVPVVTGFQGVRDDGQLVTLGRGSSDTTAVFVAVALGAAECHIVTDVDGVYDRDPRLTRSARRLDRLSLDALVDLCEGGAQVVHPEAARRARTAGTLIRVYHFAAAIGPRTETCIGGARAEA